MKNKSKKEEQELKPLNDTGRVDQETHTNDNEEKNAPKREDEDEPENVPAKKPDEDEKPAIDPGDPEIKPGEKEKTREKIPVNHPGNKGL